jgi:5-amino-6-(5-phosphoribosylamino)uracil reductase
MMAMTIDGKIATEVREPARFGSSEDARRLEEQTAWADLLLIAAGTLRAYGTTFRVHREDLALARSLDGRPPQPATAVVSLSLDIPTTLPFFSRQEVPRIVVTSGDRAGIARERFTRLAEVIAEGTGCVDWPATFSRFAQLGFHRILLLGGGKLNGELLSCGFVDELYLTVAPLMFGGTDAPTISDVAEATLGKMPDLTLSTIEYLGDELYLQYRTEPTV